MSKRQFIALAKALRDFRTHGNPQILTDAIADVCAQSNPNFNRAKFKAAIMD